MIKVKVNCILMSFIMAASLCIGNITANAATTATAATSKTATTTNLTLANMPSNLKPSIEWVWNNRIVKDNTPSFRNLIFDQIYAGKGTLNYVIRWQSNKTLTLQQRQSIATMLNRQVNNWITKALKGYDGWRYSKVTVNIVGWACANPALILNKQSNETVYTDYTIDDLNKTNSSIPAQLPYAPTSLSRADHYFDTTYAYPGGLSKRFDEYLWGTSNFVGGAGGDWGQRVSDDYIISNLNSTECHIIEHEMGHGFGLPDFYEDADRPPTGFPTHTIMWAGDSMNITDWDIWMLRYTWSQLKKDTSRFK